MRWEEALKIKQNWTAEQARNDLERLIITGERPADKVVGLACQALDKQITKKVELEGDGYDENGNLIYDTGYCPNCRHIFEVDYDATKHCPECGQALDWSDSDAN